MRRRRQSGADLVENQLDMVNGKRVSDIGLPTVAATASAIGS